MYCHNMVLMNRDHTQNKRQVHPSAGREKKDVRRLVILQRNVHLMCISLQRPILGEKNDSADSDLEPDEYHYIVPNGLNVIFQDEDGNEITR